MKSCATLHQKTLTFGGTLHFHNFCQKGSLAATECDARPSLWSRSWDSCSASKRYADRTEYKSCCSIDQAQKSPCCRPSGILFTACASMGNKFSAIACEFQLTPSFVSNSQTHIAIAPGRGQIGLPPMAPGIQRSLQIFVVFPSPIL
jgi:hypothetical protein